MKIKSLKHNISLKLMYIGEILYFNNKNINIRDAIMREIPEKGTKLLDMCTGTAQNAIKIAEKNRDSNVVAIDISPKAVQIAKKRIYKKKINNIDIKRMDACRTSFKEKEFDCIFISLVLHELDDKYIDKIMHESKRIIKDNGYIIVTEWVKPSSFWKKVKFFLLYIIEPVNFREFIKIDLKKFLNKAGLGTVNAITSNYTVTYFCKVL